MRSPLPRLILALLAVAALSSACQSQGTRLHDLPTPQITVSPLLVDASTHNTANLVFGFQVTLSYGASCLELDDAARGTINGERAPEWSAGGWQTEINLLEGNSSTCLFPSFQLPLELADADQVTVAFEDGTTRIAATVLNLGRVPTLTLTPPPDGHISQGSTIELTYAPATDDLTDTQWVLQGPTSIPVDLSQLQGSSVQFTIPANQPIGPTSIEGIGRRFPSVVACEGADRCEASVYPFLAFPNAPAVFQPISAHFTIEP